MNSYNKPLPDISNPLTAPFWDGLRRRELRVQRCKECRALRFPASAICPECLASAAEWSPITPVGQLWSFVVYHRALAPSFAADVPYVVGVVELEGLHIVSAVDAAINDLRIGMAMEARFDDVTETVTLLKWIPLATEISNG